MLNQNFTGKNLLKNVTIVDIIKHKLGRDREEYLATLNMVADSINNGGNDFPDIHMSRHHGKEIYKLKNLESIYSLKHISKIITRIYKVKQTNRETITRQIITLLEDSSNFTIIKGDIKNFFDSISSEKILDKVTKDRLLSYRGRSIVKNLFQCDQVKTKGLPRGLSISTPLSELYIRDFDRYVKEIPGVYYYARYVDDFIIFTHKEKKSVLDEIKIKLSELNLDLNESKIKCISLSSLKNERSSFDFLGYSYKILEQCEKNHVVIGISDRRIRKIKTRIILTILAYSNDKNIALLKSRFMFISGNYALSTSSKKHDKKLMAGFYYNNKLANNEKQISELDRFTMKLLTSRKGGFYRKLGAAELEKITSAVKGLTFKNGFDYRKKFEFGIKNINKVTECWKMESAYEKRKR